MAYFMYPFLHSVWTYMWWFFRPYIKGFLRKTTKLCELQRICYGEVRGSPRTKGVEFSLAHSRVPEIKNLVNKMNELTDMGRFRGDVSKNATEYAFRTIIEVKSINLATHRMFRFSLLKCLLQSFGYQQLITDIESIRKIPYSSDDPDHEEKLVQLWKLLMPSEKLEGRISKQWAQIGFQGDDPKTDFRGMGILGLDNLLFFATEYNGAAQHVLTHSLHPAYGYSFAIVGINLTSMAYQLLREGRLKNHLYNGVNGQPEIKHFHQFYCYIFYEFDKTWLEEKPRDVMEFNRIRDKFQTRLETKLDAPNSLLKLNMSIETF